MHKFLIAICVLAMPGLLLAQDKQANWDNLKVLQPGQRIQVTDASHHNHSGAFSSISDQALILHGQHGDETISRETVLRVDVRGRSHRVRNVIIGGAVGAGIGAGAGYGATSNNKIGFTRGDGAALGAAFGFVAGAIVGALIPSHKNIYRAGP
jgi:hypothetical protein